MLIWHGVIKPTLFLAHRMFITFSVRIRIYRISGFPELKNKKSAENKQRARINFENSCVCKF
jgi:hypothetical protein